MPTQKTYKIIVLITYFGKFPWYFPYFLKSCQYNKTIDFLIFSDSTTEVLLPSNVKIVSYSLAELTKLISKKLSIKVNINFPYKLCDFKPAYGLIFEEYIGGYNFWGWSDIDIIFGNLRSFFTPQLLATNDFINVRHDYTTGCFALVKNNKIMNTFFMKSKDYKKIFIHEEYLGFDELNFKHCEIEEEGKELDEIETEIECFTHLIKHAAQKKIINAHFDFILLEGMPGKIKFDNGKLIYNNKYEAALYHLYWFKKVYHPVIVPKKIPNNFRISKTKIYY